MTSSLFSCAKSVKVYIDFFNINYIFIKDIINYDAKIYY